MQKVHWDHHQPTTISVEKADKGQHRWTRNPPAGKDLAPPHPCLHVWGRWAETSDGVWTLDCLDEGWRSR